ncbi:MAG: hypothetical protein FIB01_10835 [Gemmatimonadetes bacterium]|nr:hypothetical protein [Gemmatimonadota bacterium]
MRSRSEVAGRTSSACLGTLLLAGWLAACGDATGPEKTARVLESATLGAHAPQAQATLYALTLGLTIQTVTDADMYAVRYRTTGLDGQTVRATGAVWLPSATGSGWPTLAYLHGTSLPKSNAPSSTANTEGSAIGTVVATSGFIAVLPDYIGMGTGDGIPLWQHAETEAAAGADLLRAAQELAAQKGVKQNGKLFVAGYSQGGHAAMALHRRLQQRGEFAVTAAAPMAGAYDISGTARGMIQDNAAYGPSVLYTTYLLAVYNHVYHFAPSLAAIFAAPYDAVAADLLTGNFSSSSISSRLPTRPQDLLQPAFLQAVLAQPGHALWTALADNDVYDWKPNAPVRLFHGGADRDVPFQNALTAATRMQALGGNVQAVNVGAALDHTTALIPSFTGALQFFQGYR